MSELAVAENHDLSAIDDEQLVTMMVDNQLFGIPILLVQDIVEPMQITPVPLAPSAIAGVLNLRGRIVTVIDLRECLNAKRRDDVEKQMSVTVEYKGDLYTLLVDSIGDVRSLPKKHFDAPPSTLDENMKRICSGIFQLEGNLLVVLDVEKILNEESLMKMPRITRKRRSIETKNKKKDDSGKKPEAEVKKASTADQKEDNDSKAPSPSANSTTQPVRPAKPSAGASSDTLKKAPSTALKKAPASSSATRPKPPSIKPTASKPAAKPEPKPAPKPQVASSSVSGAMSFSAPPPDASGAYDDTIIMKAVELYAAKIDVDPVLQDLFTTIGDVAMLDLLTELFQAALGGGSDTKIKACYKKMIDQPGLGDDHFMNAGTAMHAVLVESDIAPNVTDKIMTAVDMVRIELMD